MIKYVNSNVFNTDADAIVNTINCVGFMGKGLALEFSLRYPNLLKKYKEKCQNKEITTGKIYYYKEESITIVNFPTKKDYKFPANIKWIEEDLKDFANTYKNYNITKIAFPLLGCGYGGLNKHDVLKLMEKYLSNLDIEVLICLDKENPQGKELEMIKSFNNNNIVELAKNIRLTNKQQISLIEKQHKINRFYQISQIEGIGFETYKKIHNYFYKNDIKFEQQKLF